MSLSFVERIARDNKIWGSLDDDEKHNIADIAYRADQLIRERCYGQETTFDPEKMITAMDDNRFRVLVRLARTRRYQSRRNLNNDWCKLASFFNGKAKAAGKQYWI